MAGPHRPPHTPGDQPISVAPSGQQFEIVAGPHRATLVEVGGGVRSYTHHGRPVLDGYPVDQMCTGARGTPLIPWPNRLADGAYTFGGTDYQVALTEPEAHNAIHGFLRWRNLGATPCPYAAGQHPYLTAGTEFVDEATLTLDATSWLPTDDRGLPTGAEPVAGSPYDFRTARLIGDTHIDYAFTGLARDGDGLAWVRLSAPNGRRVRLWADEHYRFIELYTGDTQPPERRRRGLGVEPMTCAPNGFRTGEGLLALDPGQTITTRWGTQPD